MRAQEFDDAALARSTRRSASTSAHRLNPIDEAITVAPQPGSRRRRHGRHRQDHSVLDARRDARCCGRNARSIASAAGAASCFRRGRIEGQIAHQLISQFASGIPAEPMEVDPNLERDRAIV